MDVTPQILEHHKMYGASDSTKQGYISSNRCLNYGNGNTIQDPELETISNIPRNIQYEDTVGLFGAENHFIKLTMKLENPVSGLYELNGYETAVLSVEPLSDDPYSEVNAGGDVPGHAFIDYNKDTEDDDDGSCLNVVCIDEYEPATMGADIIPALTSKYFKVELQNLKTGNKYIDAWLDVRLYNKNRDEHPYDVMYVKQGEFFYIGFHARNTKKIAL